MAIKILKTDESSIPPTKGSESAAGYDLYAHTDNGGTVEIAPGQTMKIGTGICIAIPNGFFGAVFARSGMAAESGLRPANCVGVIDSDYRGEIIVALHNDSEQTQVVNNGDRIAQLVIMPFVQASFEEVDDLDETARGDGGFGSTGVGVKQEMCNKSIDIKLPTCDKYYEQLSLFDTMGVGGAYQG